MPRSISAFIVFLFSFMDLSLAQDAPPAPPFTPQSPTYKTGKTSVSEIETRKVAATVVPPNLTLQAQAQFQLSETLASNPTATELGARRSSTYLESCDPSAAAFDWRAKNAVTPVKDQGDCGDCFIFAATAAFEASWYLQNKQKILVSEQQLLDCANVGGCEGGWHGDVFNALKANGVTNQDDVPYVSHPSGSCKSTKHPYTAVNWGYVDKSGAAASPRAIKEALCTHGPVASAVYATQAFKTYLGGVFNEFAEGEGSSSVNHDVLIVGWDNKRDAWLIKNSWGTNAWGENGYMWIRYRSNYIGFGAAWVDAVKLPAPTQAEDPANLKIKESAIRLNEETANKIAAQGLALPDRLPVPADAILKSLGIPGIKF